MSFLSDDEDVRTVADDLLLAGRDAPGGEPALAAFVAAVRALADEPAPPPTPALATLLRDGLPVTAAAPIRRPRAAASAGLRLRRTLRWAAGLGLAGKVVLGAGAAVAGVTGVATFPAVPDAVQEPVRSTLGDIGQWFTGAQVPERVVPAGVSPTDHGAATEGGPGHGALPDTGSGDERDGRSATVEPNHGVGSGEAGKPSEVPVGPPTQPPGGPVDGVDNPGRGAGASDGAGSSQDAGTPGAGRSGQGHGAPDGPGGPEKPDDDSSQ